MADERKGRGRAPEPPAKAGAGRYPPSRKDDAIEPDEPRSFAPRPRSEPADEGEWAASHERLRGAGGDPAEGKR